MNERILGRAVWHEWELDPDWISVNHGSFGATPRVVLATQQKWRQRMEVQTGRFFVRELPGALRESAARLGRFIGADGADIAFVENATVGCNTVLRSLRLTPDDEVLVLSHGYTAVRNAVRFVTERAGAKIIEAALPFLQAETDAIVASVTAALTPHTRLAVIDHITSPSALVLPIDRIGPACREVGVPVLVDGAHGPGQVPLDLRAIAVDYYVGNCHKWLCAAKGCGFLWVRPEHQLEVHPLAISNGLGRGFLEEFDWAGTRDPSAFLSLGAALDFHEWLGGRSLMARNKSLATEATTVVCDCLNTEPIASGELTAAMGLIQLPFAEPATDKIARVVRKRLLDAHVDVAVHPLEGALWARLSAYAYNDIEDYERLARALANVSLSM